MNDQPFVVSTTQVSGLDWDWSGTQQLVASIYSPIDRVIGYIVVLCGPLDEKLSLLRRVRIPHSEATSNSWSVSSWLSVVVLPVLLVSLFVVMSVALSFKLPATEVLKLWFCVSVGPVVHVLFPVVINNLGCIYIYPIFAQPEPSATVSTICFF